MLDENVTELPWQKGLDDADILIDPGSGEFVCIVNSTDITGLPVTQGRLEVSRQVILSPSLGIQLNTLLLVPLGVPFTNHW
jgi:hypothetical protein